MLYSLLVESICIQSNIGSSLRLQLMHYQIVPAKFVSEIRTSVEYRSIEVGVKVSYHLVSYQ